MKFDITIKDATLAEAQEIVKKLSGTSVEVAKKTEVSNGNTVPNFPSAAPLNLPPHNQNFSEETTSDVTGQRDADGLPWDARIHSSNKKKKADGRWVSRRNVDESTYNQVVNELRSGASAPMPVQGGYTQPAPQYSAPPMPPVNTPHTMPAQNYGNPPIPPAAHQYGEPPRPPGYTAPANSMPPAQPATRNINDLFGKIQQICASDPAGAGSYINSLTSRLSQQFQVQVSSVNDITNRPDMIDYAFQLIAADGK